MPSLLSATALNCWMLAAQAFELPPALLYAIADVESGHRADAVAQAPNGTLSVGLMQINSSWFGYLERRGIAPAALREPCLNLQVGAWILSNEVKRYGYSWEAIGAYYAGPYDARTERWKRRHYREYARKVFRAWKRIDELHKVHSPSEPPSSRH